MKQTKALLLIIYMLAVTSAGFAQSGFVAAKGSLPAPLTGGYTLQRGYGTHVVGGVELGSKGIFIKGKSGCHARAIFEGKVSAVYKFDSGYCVVLRHGSYLTVYARLEDVDVKVGQTVKALASLGKVGRNDKDERVLHFQLRQEREPLNPCSWLKL